MTKPIFAPIALLAAAILIHPAQAAAPEQLRVAYQEPDLAGPQGAEALQARVETAVRAVCPAEGGTVYALAMPRCRAAARRAARAQMEIALQQARRGDQFASR